MKCPASKNSFTLTSFFIWTFLSFLAHYIYIFQIHIGAKIQQKILSSFFQVRRGSEPSLHNKPGSSDNIVTAASSGSVQAVIASINARSVSISSAAASSVTSMAAPNTVKINSIIMLCNFTRNYFQIL